ncbi:MAG: GyrI-like domain-containing protein [Oscillospiraceae bacterium]|jgi:hypothetical protein|nr:GyrI-like domain-containing protein [Oscillospiraceae bacterium]
MPFDFKKEYKELYSPKPIPSFVDVPAMTFIMIDGEGDPNTSKAYQNAVATLYGLSYSIKMSKKSVNPPEGYFDFVVPPLEGLWQNYVTDKNSFQWTSMIRQPEFVTQIVFEQAKETLAKKKPNLDLSLARLEVFTEGLCAQITHIGSYDDEPSTIAALDGFIRDSAYKLNFTEEYCHHEIYLADPRKTVPEKLRTIIRHPVKVGIENTKLPLGV